MRGNLVALGADMNRAHDLLGGLGVSTPLLDALCEVARKLGAYGAKLTGCTVHFAYNEYDHGPIIVQRPVPVFDDDTPEALAGRVFQQECEAYPEAIRLFAEGRLRLEGRRVRILQ